MSQFPGVFQAPPLGPCQLASVWPRAPAACNKTSATSPTIAMYRYVRPEFVRIRIFPLPSYLVVLQLKELSKRDTAGYIPQEVETTIYLRFLRQPSGFLSQNMTITGQSEVEEELYRLRCRCRTA